MVDVYTENGRGQGGCRMTGADSGQTAFQESSCRGAREIVTRGDNLPALSSQPLTGYLLDVAEQVPSPAHHHQRRGHPQPAWQVSLRRYGELGADHRQPTVPDVGQSLPPRPRLFAALRQVADEVSQAARIRIDASTGQHFSATRVHVGEPAVQVTQRDPERSALEQGTEPLVTLDLR
jgi:hypothetical protein